MKNLKLFICMTCIAAIGCFLLVGCGKNNSTSGNNTQENSSGSDNANGTGEGDVIGGAVGDIADGIGDMTSGFTNYKDAHDYFMDQMGRENSNAQYELRNESEDLTTYDGSTQGYHFELYDTANNSDGEKVGDFYLEPNSGKIYQKDASSGKFNEYKFSGSGANGTGNNGTGTNGTGSNGAGTR